MLNKKITALTVCILMLVCGANIDGQTRIKFARGHTSATVNGTLAGGGMRRYVLSASRGQELSGNISSRGDCVKFSEGSTSTSFTTRSGDNWISVTNYCGRSASFTMTVSINY